MMTRIFTQAAHQPRTNSVDKKTLISLIDRVLLNVKLLNMSDPWAQKLNTLKALVDRNHPRAVEEMFYSLCELENNLPHISDYLCVKYTVFCDSQGIYHFEFDQKHMQKVAALEKQKASIMAIKNAAREIK